ncbi:MAG TPA: outer membrane lipoprotein-sorting protein [Verrucomicrobiales bacterium]|nr:outer membrane lipoprotein-sorting protein [Verrucomicrobiae bacterium]HRX55683.1 outer membrane lipoprotein-sorting protein [Verrucomicrobiales bacterium]
MLPFRCLLILMLGMMRIVAQEANPRLDLVRKLDALRLPGSSFTATVTIQKTSTKRGEPEVAHFTQQSRRRVEANGRIVFDTLVRCIDPVKDAGKALLFVGDACWFYAPKARNASRLSSSQVAAEALVADLINWSFADEFDHKVAGSERIEVGGTKHACTVLDFTPKSGIKNRSPLVRCWVDDQGRPWKTEHYTASRRLFRSVLFVKYAKFVDGVRPVGLVITSAGAREEIVLGDARSAVLTDELFDPARLPLLGKKD